MTKTQQIVAALNISLANAKQVADSLSVGFYGITDRAGNLTDIPAGELAYAELWATRGGVWTRKIARLVRGVDGIWRA